VSRLLATAGGATLRSAQSGCAVAHAHRGRLRRQLRRRAAASTAAAGAATGHASLAARNSLIPQPPRRVRPLRFRAFMCRQVACSMVARILISFKISLRVAPLSGVGAPSAGTAINLTAYS